MKEKTSKGYVEKTVGGKASPKRGAASNKARGTAEETSPASSGANQQAVAAAVARLAGTIARLAKVDPDEDMYVTKPGKPASAKAVAAYEKRLGRALPPSYRAFLLQHDGYRGLNIDGDFVSIAEASPGGACHRHVMELKAWNGPGVDWDAIIPIANIEGQHDFVYLDPARVGPGEELGVVAWYHDDDPEEYVDLLAYLEHRANRGNEMVSDLERSLEVENRARDHQASGVQFEVVVDAAFTPDGAVIATLGQNILLWNARGLGPAKDGARSAPLLREIVAPPDWENARLEFSSDGSALRCGTIVWDVATGSPIQAGDKQFELGPGRLQPKWVGGSLVPEDIASPDGSYIVRVEGRNVIVRRGGDARTLSTLGRAVAFSPDGKLLIATQRCQRNPGLRVWELSSLFR